MHPDFSQVTSEAWSEKPFHLELPVWQKTIVRICARYL